MKANYREIKEALHDKEPELSTTELGATASAITFLLKAAAQFDRIPNTPMAEAWSESLVELAEAIFGDDLDVTARFKKDDDKPVKEIVRGIVPSDPSLAAPESKTPVVVSQTSRHPRYYDENFWGMGI